VVLVIVRRRTERKGSRRMTAPDPGINPYEFILENIESVPHLEALVLLWNSRPVGWASEELASRLYVSAERAAQVLRDLVRRQLIAESPGSPPRYSYLPRSEKQDELLASLDSAYRKDLVRISTMIHSKASSGVREFARAFNFKQEKK
jgi:DNA-binding MarR family transcriptional regulator